MTFQPGFDKNRNCRGRPAKPEAVILRQALEKCRKKYGLHLIESAIQRSYTDSVLCAAILKKILPDKLETEFIDGIKIILVRPGAVDGKNKNGKV